MEITDCFFFYLDSDLSDNEIGVLNADDFASLNFLQKLLVRFTIYEHYFSSTPIIRHGMCTLTIYSTLYLSSLIKENIDQIN